MDMTQILLAVVGSIAVWALKSVIDLQKQQTELKGELSSILNHQDSERTYLNYRLDELKAGVAELKRIISTIAQRKSDSLDD